MAEAEQVPVGVDPTRPSPARMYDYMLGGTRNLQVDRDATERFLARAMPDLLDAASANRGISAARRGWIDGAWHPAVHRHLAWSCPRRTTPTRPCSQIDPEVRVVYVDPRPDGAAVYACERASDDA